MWHDHGAWWDSKATDDDEFFTRQEERAGRWTDDAQQPFITRSGDADLLVADSGQMAIEATAIEATAGEAKTFYATTAVVKAANSAPAE